MIWYDQSGKWPKEKTVCMLIGFKLSFYNSIETQNNYSKMTCLCDMSTSKENSQLDHQSKYVVFHFFSWYFLQEIANMFSVF